MEDKEESQPKLSSKIEIEIVEGKIKKPKISGDELTVAQILQAMDLAKAVVVSQKYKSD